MGMGAIWIDVFYLSLIIVTSYLLDLVLWKYKLKTLSYFPNTSYCKIWTSGLPNGKNLEFLFIKYFLF